SVRPREKKSLNIRIPGWVDRNTVRVWICGEKACENEYKGNYLHIGNSWIHKGKEVRIEFDLPEYKTEEVMKTSKRKFHLHWRGDNVVYCNPEVPIYSKQE
ncbi:MAG TPA: glycoside hydrolase family 127 protein, partial [Clostridia bacterium]|nr:glycoside hydrolase family 127 protein [Clostridia bacterium]